MLHDEMKTDTKNVNIAVVILTYNESLHLARCLSHVEAFAREVFVVDSFSTDETVEIARASGAHVFQHPFQNQAKQFQWALDTLPIGAEWVMRLDADEIIEADLAEEINTKLHTLTPDVTGIYLNRKTIFQGKFIRHGGRYPMYLLRIWRRGKARIEDRWMDEHTCLIEGRSVHFHGGFADHSLFDLSFFTAKHNNYASREALEVVNRTLHFWRSDTTSPAAGSDMQQAGIKRLFKEHLYNRLPLEISAVAYFLYRYLIRLGFLDGRTGLIYHVLQGFWYRFLVAAKVRELKAALRDVKTADEAMREVTRLTHQKIVIE